MNESKFELETPQLDQRLLQHLSTISQTLPVNPTAPIRHLIDPRNRYVEGKGSS